MYKDKDDTVYQRQGGGLLDSENGSFLLWRVNVFEYDVDREPPLHKNVTVGASLFIGDCSRRVEIHDWGYTSEYAEKKIDGMIKELLMFKAHLVKGYAIRQENKDDKKKTRYHLC